MKLEKAIEIAKQLSEPPAIIFHPDDIKAVCLLIEAGKALPHYRSKLKYPELWLLPGETEE